MNSGEKVYNNDIVLPVFVTTMMHSMMTWSVENVFDRPLVKYLSGNWKACKAYDLPKVLELVLYVPKIDIVSSFPGAKAFDLEEFR